MNQTLKPKSANLLTKIGEFAEPSRIIYYY